jgi:hypothetical protein
MRKYVKAHKDRRRVKLLAMLGGRCVRCGASENLQFDHIDPSTKRFTIGANLSKAWAELVAEAMKCQLLCRPCHIEKSAEDRPEVPHGLYKYEYWRCRCEVCRAANSIVSAMKRERYPKRKKSRAKSQVPGTLDLDRSGVAQSAEQPAVNRLAGSSSLPPRAKRWLFDDRKIIGDEAQASDLDKDPSRVPPNETPPG